MADTIGRGVIEITADARQLKAGIDEARRSIRTLGEGQKDVSKSAQQSIDRYIGKLVQQNATLGKSVRETELYKLALRGASNEQLKAADAALRYSEAQERANRSSQAVRGGIAKATAVIVTGLIAAAVAFDQLAKKTAEFQALADQTGDTAESFASLAVAAEVGGASMESIAEFSVKLTKNLSSAGEASRSAGQALAALGIDVAKFQAMKPADQLDAMAKALNSFEDGAPKVAVIEAIADGGARLLPFLKELGTVTGRQNILTSEQVRLSAQYAANQRRLRAEISLHASAIAAELIPSFNSLSGAFLDLIRGSDAVQAGLKTLSSSNDIQAFGDIAVRVLAKVVDYVQVLARGFELVGKLIAASIAGHLALLSGEFKQAVAIYKAAFEDIREITSRPLFSTLVDKRIADRKSGTAGAPDEKRRTLNFKPSKAGAGGASPADVARQESADRLAVDLANIRRASQETINAFANAERIMGAMRSAGLVADKDYYASKLAFIRLNSQEEEKALQQELSRLERETFAGKNAAKDEIANRGKIADLHAKIALLRADATSEIELNSIAEKAAVDSVAAAYRDAKEEAQAYLDTIKRQNKREIEGVGRGQKFRDRQAALGDIEDRRIESKRGAKSDLDRNQIDQAQYAKNLADIDNYYNTEVALYEDRTTTLEQLQSDGNAGMLEGMRNFYDEAQDLSKSTSEIMTQGLDGLTDQLTDFVTTGKADFKGLADSIIKELTRAFIKKQIVGALVSYFGGFSAGTGAGASVQTSAGGYSGGGQIRGPGSGTSDSIPVLLSDKEFIVKADRATDPGALKFLNTLNQHGIATAMAATLRNATRRAEGGLVRAPAGINFMPNNVAMQMRPPATASAPESVGQSVVVNVNQSFAAGTDTRTINQAATAAGRVMQRAMRRNS